MTLAAIIAGVIFSILGILCVFSIIFGLPGTWVFLALALLVEFLDQYWTGGGTQTFSWWLLGVCLLLAVIGEILELFAGVLGAKKGGSSKRGIWGSFIGGLVGAVLGMAIPIPIIGSLIGALLGTFAGAVIGELTVPAAAMGDEGGGGEKSVDMTRVRDTLEPATWAAIGRILGTLSKLPIAFTVWLALVIAYFWQ